ncbi:MAG: ATP-binding protein [Verrucomicrobiales bacterium]|nr:ATP-binding protein [Verrucomicrobiales bacterium]
MNDAAFQRVFDEQERKDRISYSTIASILSMILMPGGTLMDRFLYLEKAPFFLKLRIGSSIIVGLVWLWFHLTGKKHDRIFSVMWYAVPMGAISWMIYAAGDPRSPYYAGLNLVLLALGLLASWNYVQNLLSALLAIVLYLVACYFTATKGVFGSLFSNLFFLVSTAAIAVCGSYVAYQQRFREFTLRYELDKNRQELERSNQKLLELGQVKDRFFANISHELRTPLTLLISPLEILLFQKGSLLTEEQKGLAQMMHANAMQLLKMINDLLDLVRLESGRMEVKREPIEITEFVKSLNSATRQLAQDKQLQLRMDVAPGLTSALADRDKLEKICLNLLFNAIKFTPAGGLVELTVQTQQDQLVMAVRDTGVGISANNLPFVFDRFWQADNSSKRKFKGVGIGLSLVKELTEIQGGKATVESEEGKGTTFTIRLPYVKADSTLSLQDNGDRESQRSDRKSETGVQSEEWLTNLYRRAELFSTLMPEATNGQASVPAAHAGGADNEMKPTVVIADDEPGMVNFLRSQIQQRYRVVEAVDGREAVEKVSQHLPDVVLLDMNMPEKDGLQVCRELRENSGTQKIPIILLTARADEETKLAALSAGANDFLPKPFSVAELHVRLKNLIQSHDYQQKLHHQNQILAQTIEQLKQTETQLVQTAKMASLGRMSAGIIHEINNPLNFASTGLYTLRGKGKSLPSDQQAEYAEIIRDIDDGLKRVRDIVTDLRTFTHPETSQVDEVDVSEAVASALRYLSNEWRGKVQMNVNLAKDQTVRANKNRLTQVLLNLLQNAIDAMKKKTFADDVPTVCISGQVTPEKSVILIHDNGEGIEPQHLDKIFDPFFTTKDVGDGMGLGLSICYRLVREHGGQIRVRSERGKFTEFALEFPTAALN